MNYPPIIKTLIEHFKKLPGIGEKTAERLTFAMLDFDKNDLESFSETIINVKNKIKRCQICNNLTEDDTCAICTDKIRDNHVICVVEDPKNINLIEKMGTYKGHYHVLNGLISPLDGKKPEDINITQLLKRVEKNDIKEVILAVKPTIEGETTSLYISKMLEGLGIKVTKIAHGIPMGADIEYIDVMTLEIAFSNRNIIS